MSRILLRFELPMQHPCCPVGRLKGEIEQPPQLARVAEEIELVSSAATNTDARWAGIALEILKAAPDRSAILNAFASRFHPTAWSGSRANVLAPYRQLPLLLNDHDDPVVQKWANAAIEHLDVRIRKDAERDQKSDQSFE